MEQTISKRTYKAIYRLLDMVSPVEFDCGTICGAACCIPSDDEEMGIFLLPGEECVHNVDDDWLSWSTYDIEEYGFPTSWGETGYYVTCGGPKECVRAMRPIQCRTFPVAPHLLKTGELVLIYDDMDLPYVCPLVDQRVSLTDEFINATYTVWKRLIKDKRIYDFVLSISNERDEISIIKSSDID